MKKIISLMIGVVILLSVTSCTTKSPDEWDVAALSAPSASDSLDLPFFCDIGYISLFQHPLILEGEDEERATYNFVGTYNERNYFYGPISSTEAAYYCSYDKDYKNFEKHSDITEKLGYGAMLYDGVLYNWADRVLYGYDLKTKECRELINRSKDRYGIGTIISIENGWVYTQYLYDRESEKAVVTAYNIQTGEIVEKNQKISGVFANGKQYGTLLDSNGYTPSSTVACYDIFDNVMTKIEGIVNSRTDGVLADDNGDIWIRDYHDDGEGYTLKKIYDAKSSDAVHNQRDDIINGWYYYLYTPSGSEKQTLARLNLKTGQHQYFPKVVFEGYM